MNRILLIAAIGWCCLMDGMRSEMMGRGHSLERANAACCEMTGLVLLILCCLLGIAACLYEPEEGDQ